MNKWLFRIHRWVGAVVGLFFLMWCLSGLVLVYHPFPNVDERDLQARMEPLPDSLPAVDSVAQRLPEGAAAKVRTVTVRRFQGQTLFDFETKDTTYTLCADSAEVRRPVTAETIRNAARRWGAVDTVTYGSQPVALAAIVRSKDNTLHFASMDASGTWTTGDAVPTTFPTEGFGSTSYEAAYRRHLLIAGGRRRDGILTDQAWETTDGRTWICLNQYTASGLPALEGAAVANYSGAIVLVGGLNASGTAQRTLYLSYDRGATWIAAAHKLQLPTEFVARGYASAAVTSDGYLLLVGGRTSRTGAMMDELWRGRINRLGYGR